MPAATLCAGALLCLAARASAPPASTPPADTRPLPQLQRPPEHAAAFHPAPAAGVVAGPQGGARRRLGVAVPCYRNSDCPVRQYCAGVNYCDNCSTLAKPAARCDAVFSDCCSE